MMGPAMFELYSSNSNDYKTSSHTTGGAQRVRRTTSGSLITAPDNTQSLNCISGGKMAEDLAAIRQLERIKQSNSPTRHRSLSGAQRLIYKLKYVGSSTLDRTYTLPMLPWIIADVKRQSMCSDGYSAINVILEITESAVKIVNRSDKQVLLYHPLNNISKFTQTIPDKTWFSYLFREKPDNPFTIHIFQAPDENVVSELFNKMRESRKEILQKETGQGLQRTKSGSGLETILTYSNQYEVMYVGSIRMSQKRAHPTVIDDAIEKFKELENLKLSQTDLNSEQNSVKTKINGLNIQQNNPELNKPIEIDNQIQNNGSSLERIITMPTTRRFLVKVIEEGSERSNAVSPIETSNEPSTESSTAQTSLSPATNSLLMPTTLIPNTQSLDAETRVTLLKELRDFQRRNSQVMDSPDNVFDSPERKRSISGDTLNNESIQLQKQISLPMSRPRLGSGGSLDMSRPRNIRYKNKTMLFLIGKLELCLISTDKHKVVLNKTFSNISHCSQGIKNGDHFGIICREPSLNTAESYVIHVFMCQSEKLVSEIMHSLKQAFSNAYQSSKNRTQYICDTCPMHWFHRLCCDIEGQPPEKTQAIILNRLEALPFRDREECLRKCQGIKVNSLHEQNELFMSGLKVMCELKQKKHTHSGTQEKRSLEKRLSVNTLDNLKEKAKTSISNTFESIFKLSRNESSESLISSPSYSQKSAPIDDLSDEIQQRPRSNTLSEIKDLIKDSDEKLFNRSDSLAVHQNSNKKPLLNIFMKVGSQTKLNVSSVEDTPKNNTNKNQMKSPPSGSWRQTIFNRIHITANNSSSDKKTDGSDQTKDTENNNSIKKSIEMNELPKKKTTEQLRQLWKSAIKQQMILNKMDKQNQRIQDDQSSTYDKRMKLDYDEIPNFTDATQLWDATKSWDSLINDHKMHTKLTYNQLLKAVRLGVPRYKKGEIWLFLAEQHRIMCDKRCDSPEQDTPYRQLLGQLTTQQHAILVDLGRTFPKVAYYAQTLGTGQLSLFNLLKAYSLYDTEVEYCQGLSFVAGILLLHMSEDDSFEMMKYILFHRGLRKQYKPEMDALQMQLYQLTRLLYDHNHSLYLHFEDHDIAPTLYAAPWFLTLFASQFPISFVTRLFDILFLMGIEAIFRVSLVLLDVNSTKILECQSFETIMEFLKEDLPAMELSQMELVFERVFALDIKHELDAYEVEYHVIQEELIHVSKANNSSNSSLNSKLSESEVTTENQNLRQEVQELTQQIQVYQTKCNQLQSQCDNYFSTIKRLEQRVRACEDEKDALVHSVSSLQKRNKKLEILTKSVPNIKELMEMQQKNRSDSISSAPVFSISRPEHQSSQEAEDDDEECVVDDDDIDINSDSDDKGYNKLNRTQSDTSNLSI